MRFLIGAVFALLAVPALADECKQYSDIMPPDIALFDMTDQRLKDVVERVRVISNTTEPFLVCEWTGPYMPIPHTSVFGQKRPGTVAFIVFVPRAVKDNLTTESLLGVIAHEFAHTHGALEKQATKSGKPLSRKQNRQTEKIADALAAKWIGYETVRRALDEEFGLMEKFAREHYAKFPESDAYRDQELKKYDAERQDRIRALEAWNKMRTKKRGR